MILVGIVSVDLLYVISIEVIECEGYRFATIKDELHCQQIHKIGDILDDFSSDMESPIPPRIQKLCVQMLDTLPVTHLSALKFAAVVCSCLFLSILMVL